jgi:hypothetical protein
MVEALLRIGGAEVISFGTEMPIMDTSRCDRKIIREATTLDRLLRT